MTSSRFTECKAHLPLYDIAVNKQWVFHPGHLPQTLLKPVCSNALVQLKVEGPEQLGHDKTHLSLCQRLHNLSVEVSIA